MSKSENVLSGINKRLVTSEDNMTKFEAKQYTASKMKHREKWWGKKLKQVLMSCRMTSISLIYVPKRGTILYLFFTVTIAIDPKLSLKQHLLSHGASQVTQQVKNPPAMQEMQVEESLIPTSGRSRRRAGQPTLVSLPGESHGQRKLVGCCPWGHKELDTTEAAKHARMHNF